MLFCLFDLLADQIISDSRQDCLTNTKSWVRSFNFEKMNINKKMALKSILKPNCLRELSLLCKPTKTIRFCVYYWFWYKSSYISFPRLITRCSFWRFYLWFYSTSGNIIKIGNLWIIKIWFNYITLWYSVFKPTYFFMNTCRMLYVFL